MYNKYDLAPSNDFKPVPPTVIAAFPRSAWDTPKAVEAAAEEEGGV